MSTKHQSLVGWLQVALLVAIGVVFIFAGTTDVLAHPGRTDSSGGHTCRTNCPSWGRSYGEYHTHGSTQTPRYNTHNNTPPPVENTNPAGSVNQPSQPQPSASTTEVEANPQTTSTTTNQDQPADDSQATITNDQPADENVSPTIDQQPDHPVGSLRIEAFGPMLVATAPASAKQPLQWSWVHHEDLAMGQGPDCDRTHPLYSSHLKPRQLSGLTNQIKITDWPGPHYCFLAVDAGGVEYFGGYSVITPPTEPQAPASTAQTPPTQTPTTPTNQPSSPPPADDWSDDAEPVEEKNTGLILFLLSTPAILLVLVVIISIIIGARKKPITDRKN